MLKVQIFDGADEPLTFICEQTMEWYKNNLKDNRVVVVGLTEIKTSALITIPIRQYIVKVSEIEE